MNFDEFRGLIVLVTSGWAVLALLKHTIVSMLYYYVVEQRETESSKIRLKYPERIPVSISNYASCKYLERILEGIQSTSFVTKD